MSRFLMFDVLFHRGLYRCHCCPSEKWCNGFHSTFICASYIVNLIKNYNEATGSKSDQMSYTGSEPNESEGTGSAACKFSDT